MSRHQVLVERVRHEVHANHPPVSAIDAFDLLNPVSLGLKLPIPALSKGSRLFRIRKLDAKPLTRGQVGAPPARVAPIGRLNDHGESVLYLADSPNTAFAEARAGAGDYCLAEWRTQPHAVALANGGFDSDALKTYFPNNLSSEGIPLGGVEDSYVASFFTEIFTLSASEEPRMYWWSIACGMTSGFAHRCERTGSEVVGGNTMWTGRFPMAGIAYPSMRRDKKAVNFAFNDLGQTYLELNHVQWVRRGLDGSFTGLDIATSWDDTGTLNWTGRPAHYVLQPGQAARARKVAKDAWLYENLDGSIPTFA